MSTIIKATDRNSAIQHVAFNLDDMAEKARQCLQQVRTEAGQILAAARQKATEEAIEVKRQAQQEGRRAGQEAIEQIVQEQLGRQLATLMPALRQAMADLKHAKQAWLIHWEKSAVHVAAAIARRILRGELAAQPEIAVPLIRESLQLAAGSGQIRLHLHPADYQALRPQVDMLISEFASLGSAEVVPDAEISPGGCRVETRFGVIDQQIEAQLARIEEELT
jgi:flagellar assembly protein FliH